MNLQNYTDQQLKDELKRRKYERWANDREERTKHPYIYWEGIITEKADKRLQVKAKNILFKVKDQNGSEHLYSLCSDRYFTKDNMPKVGGKVRLRYKNGKGYTCNKAYSKIVEVV